MLDWRESILARLEKYSGYEVKQSGTELRVLCKNPSSFEVSIRELDSRFLVCFDGWHEEFDIQKTALDCFAFGLTDHCRLKVVMRGSMECAWTVQSRGTNGWDDDSTTGLLLIPFWRPRRVIFRQNSLKLRS